MWVKTVVFIILASVLVVNSSLLSGCGGKRSNLIADKQNTSENPNDEKEGKKKQVAPLGKQSASEAEQLND